MLENQKPQLAALRLALPRQLRLQVRNHPTRNMLNPTHQSNFT
jgi:hypothetical protein